jgi:DNA-binding MarR family transcriptional regulator
MTARGSGPESRSLRIQGSESTAAPPAEPVPVPPFRAIGFMLSSAGHAVAKGFAAVMAPYELEPREFALMRRLALIEGASQQALADKLGIAASRMVGLIDGMEQRNLIERRQSLSDRRARALFLTPAGRQLLGRAAEAAAEYEQHLTQDLDATECAELRRMLDCVSMRLGLTPGMHGAEPRE